MRALIDAGEIGAGTHVWSRGMNGWLPASESRLAAQFIREPPPLRGPAPARGFLEAVKTCFSKYVTFSGRASRSEFWWFALFCGVIAAVLGALDDATRTVSGDTPGALSVVFSLATLLPWLAVTSRRYHDAGWRFWWYLLPGPSASPARPSSS